MTNFKLELKQPDVSLETHIFYRYRYNNFVIWFSQCQKTGNIYMVNVRRDENADIHYSIISDCREKMYPTEFEVSTYSLHLKTIFDCDKVSNVLAEIKDLLGALYYFFTSSDHARLYCEKHGVTKISE